MKHLTISLVALLCFVTPVIAQTESEIKRKMEDAKIAIQQWDKEHLLDSLDQEQLPRIVTGGLMMSANMSNFIILNAGRKASSYMRIGGELGAFIDFTVTKHFAIQGRLIFTAEQNRFAIDDTRKLMWSFGMDIPVFFLGRFGNMEKGYLQFGGGPYTHFTFASNVPDKYSNDLATVVVENTDAVLHDNHSGLCATIGYEFPIGIQINANYLVSLSDILSYRKQTVNTSPTGSMYPQRLSLGIAYRWK